MRINYDIPTQTFLFGLIPSGYVKMQASILAKTYFIYLSTLGFTKVLALSKHSSENMLKITTLFW
jgi:hypothetical protein